MIRFEGEIDLVTGPQFREQLEEAAGLKDHLIVDLQGVTYLDSKAIHALIRCHDRAFSRTPRRLIVIATSPSIRRILSIGRIETVIPVVETEEEALSTVREESGPELPSFDIPSLVAPGHRLTAYLRRARRPLARAPVGVAGPPRA
jgi:anti-anti-sigma factor